MKQAWLEGQKKRAEVQPQTDLEDQMVEVTENVEDEEVFDMHDAEGMGVGNQFGKVYKTLWHCGWPKADGYPGAYPDRYLKYMQNYVTEMCALPWNPLAHFFSGSVKGDGANVVTFDVNVEQSPSHIVNLTKDQTPYPDDHFAVVLADPPYQHKGYDAAKELYADPKYGGGKEVKRYSFVKEAVRILRPGGIFAVMHVLPYATPLGTSRNAIIGVTTGTTQVIRVVSVFKKDT